MHEWLAQAKQSGCVDRNHHRPFQSLGAVDDDDLDGVAFGINPALVGRTP